MATLRISARPAIGIVTSSSSTASQPVGQPVGLAAQHERRPARRDRRLARADAAAGDGADPVDARRRRSAARATRASVPSTTGTWKIDPADGPHGLGVEGVDRAGAEHHGGGAGRLGRAQEGAGVARIGHLDQHEHAAASAARRPAPASSEVVATGDHRGQRLRGHGVGDLGHDARRQLDQPGRPVAATWLGELLLRRRRADRRPRP